MKRRADLEGSSPHCLFVESYLPAAIGGDATRFIAGVVYHRLADQGALAAPCAAMAAAVATGLPVLLVGDLNAQHQLWSGATVRACNYGMQLVNFCDAHDLTVLNANYCRGVPHTGLVPARCSISELRRLRPSSVLWLLTPVPPWCLTMCL